MRTIRHVAIALVLAGIWNPAGAQTVAGTLSVTTEVRASCSIVSATLDFGDYTSGQDSDLDVDGAFTYSGCIADTLTVELDPGLLGDSVSRRMENASGERIRYNIHRTAARNNIWGRFTNAVSFTPDPSGDGSIPLHGRIIGDQSVSSGAFTDTIGIVLTF